LDPSYVDSTLAYISIVAIAFLFENIYPKFVEWNQNDGKQVLDISLTLMNGTSEQVIHDILRLFYTGIFFKITPYFLPVLNFWDNKPFIMKVVSAILLGDLGAWYAHYLSHKRGTIWWQFHAIHHSVERIYVINAGRFHPLDTMVQVIFSFSILYITGLGTEDMLFW